MPSGRTHDRITLWTLPWIVGGSSMATRNGVLALIVSGAFLFSGLMFGPDLDIYSVQYKRWGWLRWIWLPYQKMLRHRSLWSHGPIIGTTLRLLYLLSGLGLVGIVAVAIAQAIWNFPWNWHAFIRHTFDQLRLHQGEAIALWIGLELGSLSHAIADTLGSTHRRVRQKGWKDALFPPKPKKRRKRSLKKR
jgi:uncharacterized metal-binding protein